MEGISIRYEFAGDEAAWRAAIDAFIDSVDADPEIAGKFNYAVHVAGDGKTRIHAGRWDSDGTLETLQSRDYFKAFAAAIKGFGGDSISPLRVTLARQTAR